MVTKLHITKRTIFQLALLLFAVFFSLAAGEPASKPRVTSVRFELDAARSKFIAHGQRGGLLWFKGHEHLIAVRKFSGTADVTSGTITPASLQLTVDTASLEETSPAFTTAQKGIINKELKEIVFHPDQYPSIVFQSTAVTFKVVGPKQYEARITGNLTLHGVTKQIVIPAKVTVDDNGLRAVGEFNIDRSDFNVKATSAFHGMVRVRDSVKITFDIVGRRV